MSRFATAALVVWAITILIGGYFFINGYTQKGSDEREMVLLTAAERDQVLLEMRGLLEATAAITAALARGDTAGVAAITKPIGAGAMASESPAMLLKLPLAFKQMGIGIHAGFDAMGDAAAGGATTEQLLTMLSDQLITCTGCHASYQFPK